MLCSKCQIDKLEQEFAFKIKSENRRHKICKVCKNKENSIYYIKNIDGYKAKARVNTKRYISENYNKICEYLSENPCVDCGESNIICLEFDHVRGEKYKEVCKMMKNSWTKILEEIEKCEVRCANCHIKRHASENNTNRFRYGSVVQRQRHFA